MQKIIAIAADYQHLINFCKDKGMLPDRFVHATSIEKMNGLHEYRYVWITDPYNRDFRRNIQQEFRKAKAIRLPLDINEWAISEFI